MKTLNIDKKQILILTNLKLIDWLDILSRIILDVNISLNNADRLFENKYPNEESIVSHGFFKHHYYQLWFICTIQLSKLVTAKKNQKYNLHFLLNELMKEKLDAQLLDLIARNKSLPFQSPYKSLKDFEESIAEYKKKLKRHSVIIKKITRSRNQLYAHRDKGAKPEELNLDQVRDLLNTCIEIYNGIRGGFYNVSVDFSYTEDWSIDHVIKKCSE